MAAYIDLQVTRTEAAQTLAVPVGYISYMQWHLETWGRLPKGRVGPPPPPRPSGRRVMPERLAQPGARDTYAMRGRSIEPVFGQLKEARDVRRLLHRGLPACRCEWRVVAAAHNLRKLWSRAVRDSASFPRSSVFSLRSCPGLVRQALSGTDMAKVCSPTTTGLADGGTPKHCHRDQ
jgi:hypothetical protein